MMGTAANNKLNLNMEIKIESSDVFNDEEVDDLEWTPEQEILLLYSLHGLKPVGPHKHFRMISIQNRLSNAMNKNIPSSIIWKKLNDWYDMEALDEAEAEADAANSVEVDFELPTEEYGELIEQKLKGNPITGQEYNTDLEPDKSSETDLKETQIKSDTSHQDHKVISSDVESSKESDVTKGSTNFKAGGKDTHKRGTKRTLTPNKDGLPQKRDGFKESGEKDETKKGPSKKEDTSEAPKKSGVDVRQEEKKDYGNKTNKKEPSSKKIPEQAKKEPVVKKTEQKKSVETPKNQRQVTKQPRTDSLKKGETKTTRSDTPKQKADSKKETSSDQKKEEEKQLERKSAEKTPESARGGKLRGRKDADEKMETPTGTKRTKESGIKATDTQSDEPLTKKAKSTMVKGRSTRSSMESQKPASPALSPQKRKTRLI